MVRVKHADVRRLDRDHRHLSLSTKKRSDIHNAKVKYTRKQTYAERKARKAQTEEQDQELNADLQLIRGELLDMCGTVAKKHGRTKEYYYTQIMQSERILKTAREKSRWNAFVSLRLSQINAGSFPSAIFVVHPSSMQSAQLILFFPSQTYPQMCRRRRLVILRSLPSFAVNGRR